MLVFHHEKLIITRERTVEIPLRTCPHVAGGGCGARQQQGSSMTSHANPAQWKEGRRQEKVSADGGLTDLQSEVCLRTEWCYRLACGRTKGSLLCS